MIKRAACWPPFPIGADRAGSEGFRTVLHAVYSRRNTGAYLDASAADGILTLEGVDGGTTRSQGSTADGLDGSGRRCRILAEAAGHSHDAQQLHVPGYR